MARGRDDRPGFPGLRVASGSGDLLEDIHRQQRHLIEDIHRQQRRRTLLRAALLLTLAIVLLLVGVVIRIVFHRHVRDEALTTAYAHYVKGTPVELDLSITALQTSIDDVAAEDPPTLVARALVRAHRWAELGDGEDEARQAVDAVPGSPPGAALAQGLLQFAGGELEAAEASLAADRAADGELPPGPFVVAERAWLAGMLAVALHPDDADALAAAQAELEAQLEREPEQVAPRRVLALVHLVAGRTEAALTDLQAAREHGRAHMGLAADEALYNAFLRQELSGVASVADQLLGAGVGMSAQDMAHAQLARAVVHVQSGEVEDALTMLDRAWEGLPAWDRLSRRLVIQSALEAGDASRIDAWVEATALPDAEGDIYRAWAVLVGGDVMEALRRLAELPQADPWVGYLQALALVEQRRFSEAVAWIDRTEKLLPGRLEIEVARARVELHQGDKKVALRKLEALAQEEARAPRAWTGLGEAYLEQDEPNVAEARKALRRAVEREPYPAEALLLLARLWDERRGKDPKAELEALSLYEQAAKANPRLPRYGEALALHLASIGFSKRALEQLEAIKDEPGVGHEVILQIVRIRAEAGEALGAKAGEEFDPEPLLAEALERGAPPHEVTRLQARIDLDSGEKARVTKAQTALAALLAASPKDVEARALYARTFLAQIDRKGAEAALRKGLTVVDARSEGRLLWVWADLEVRAGKKRMAAPRARRAFLAMLAEDRPPTELLEVADLATRAWLRVRKERTALAIAEQLTGRLGYHARAWTLRAATQLAAGEAQAARESAQRAIELDDQDPRAHEVLGHALLRFGLKDRARKEYERALALAKGTRFEAEYRQNLRRR
jgi:tetratricopeptide (TPR) repeat protein